MHEKNAMVYPPEKRPLTNQIHLENEQKACVIHYMGETQ